MTERTYRPYAPRISFTNDFHELLRGDLAPGSVVTLRYDPLRIVPADDDYVFGDPEEVTGHITARRLGILGRLSPEDASKLRSQLAKRLDPDHR